MKFTFSPDLDRRFCLGGSSSSTESSDSLFVPYSGLNQKGLGQNVTLNVHLSWDSSYPVIPAYQNGRPLLGDDENVDKKDHYVESK